QGFVFPAIHSRGNMCRIRILVVNRCIQYVFTIVYCVTARVISKLCNTSLVIGHSQSANRITADIVMQAINDSSLG
ncbi:hypothetical protein AAAT95_17285, partial [Hominifimenecus microfluidus]